VGKGSNPIEYLVYGIFRPIELITEEIFRTQLRGENIKTEKLKHYLRNIFADQIFKIYDEYGLRVRIPETLSNEAPNFASMLNNEFLECPFLQKDLLNGKQTSTNVPFILAIIVLMIRKEIVKVSTKLGNEVKTLFNTREGTIKANEKIFQSGIRGGRGSGRQSTMYYANQVHILFTWGGRKDMELRDLFQAIVYRVSPFDDPTVEDVDTSTAPAGVSEANRRKQHFRKVNDVYDHLVDLANDENVPGTKPSQVILHTLMFKEKEEKKKVLKKVEAVQRITGWLSTHDMSNVKSIVKNKDYNEEVKKQKIFDELTKMKKTFYAKATNIEMHLNLWSESTVDLTMDDDSSAKTSGLTRLFPLNDQSFERLTKPPSKKGAPPIPYPPP